ncbi:MAG: hypothetical protein HQK66_10835, partial [Desulfamplus sp.]|nr:hypothetical protein [Desulfamplus sp.]
PTPESLDGTTQTGSRAITDFSQMVPVDALADQTEDKVSLTVQGEDPAAVDYGMTITLKDQTTQEIAPAVYALSTLTRYLVNYKVNFMINRNTGVITIMGGYRFKPDFRVTSLDNTDRTFWSSQNDRGVAWRIADFNGDGLDDLELITLTARQVIYTVPMTD